MMIRNFGHCPELESITPSSLPRDPVITKVVLKMLLAWKRYALWWFLVDSLPREEVREVVHQLRDERAMVGHPEA